MLASLYPVLSTALVLQGAFAASLERRSPAMTVPSTSPSPQSVEYDAVALSHVMGGKDRKARRSDPRVPRVFSSSSAGQVNSEARYRNPGVRGFDAQYEATTLAHVVKHGGRGRMTRRSDAQATTDLIGVEKKTDPYWGHDRGKNPPQVPGLTARLHRRGRNPSASPSRTITTPSRTLTAREALESERGHLPRHGPDRLPLIQDTEHGESGHGGGKEIGYSERDKIVHKEGNEVGYGKRHNKLGGGTAIGHGEGKQVRPNQVGHGGGNKIGPGDGNERRFEAQCSSDLIISQARINHDDAHGDHRQKRQPEAQVLPTMPVPSY